MAQARLLTDDPVVLAQLARAQGIAEAESATAETCFHTTIRGAKLITTRFPEPAALMIADAGAVGSHLYGVSPRLAVASRAELRETVLQEALPA